MKNLSSKLHVVLLFLLLFQNQLLIGKEGSQFAQGRYYIAAENIEICEDGILILGDKSLLLVKSLFHDEQGFYFTASEECGWICNWCGTINSLDADTCMRCGKPYGSNPS